ncbi:MAG: amidohydrolase family protein [Gammaproteobacteria bacterium]|nr:amidohydrolase family protein [Gammaproteobacteria bacterium]
MKNITLPGLIDIHVHMREPGATHKEDWLTGTSAALAGGFTMVLAMPNTSPSITSPPDLQLTLKTAGQKALCDFAQFLGAGPQNAPIIAKSAAQSAGLKMYLDQTYGELRLDDMTLWMSHFKHWPKNLPIAVHAEKRTMAAAILLAALYDRSLHICHISRKEEITVIRQAKEKGLKITCEVTPHHLFLTQEDIPNVGGGFAEVRPVLATPEDQQALWENIEVIDCIATDHAPHTKTEKASESPPPGFPGLETALPLMLNAVNQGRLSIDDLVKKMYTNPKRIFKLPDQPDTFVDVNLEQKQTITSDKCFTRCEWTPFEGYPVSGSVERVVLRGQQVYKNGMVYAKPGNGSDIRKIL